MGRNEPMDCRLRQGMRYLSTKQDPNPQDENPPLQNHNPRSDTAIPTNRHGSYHGTPNAQRKGRDPHHSRPRMFPSGNLPPMYHNDNRTGHCPTISRQRLSMVRTTQQDDQ